MTLNTALKPHCGAETYSGALSAGLTHLSREFNLLKTAIHRCEERIVDADGATERPHRTHFCFRSKPGKGPE